MKTNYSAEVRTRTTAEQPWFLSSETIYLLDHYFKLAKLTGEVIAAKQRLNLLFMEPDNYQELDKGALVDLMSKYTERFSSIYLGEGDLKEMEEVKEKIKAIQKEIMTDSSE